MLNLFEIGNCVFASDKLLLHYEFVNIYKKVNSLLFEHFSYFLKNMGILKGFDFFLDFEKKRSFKNFIER